jgi:translation elongation factor EF-G
LFLTTFGKFTTLLPSTQKKKIFLTWFFSSKDPAKVDKIVKALKLQIPPRDLTSNDPKAGIQAVLGKWLPLAESLLQMVVEKLPGPIEAQKIRIPALWQPTPSASPDVKQKQDQLKEFMMKCDPESSEVVVFVSKVFLVAAG